MKIRTLAAIGVCAGALLAPLAVSAHSDDPNKPVKLIVGFAPGGSTDIVARIVAQKLGEKLGQPVVVENRAGGDGLVGIQAFLGANDDHTLFFGPAATYIAHPFMRDKLPYNPSDIVPIVRTTVTVVSVDLYELRSWADLSWHLLQAANDRRTVKLEARRGGELVLGAADLASLEALDVAFEVVGPGHLGCRARLKTRAAGGNRRSGAACGTSSPCAERCRIPSPQASPRSPRRTVGATCPRGPRCPGPFA